MSIKIYSTEGSRGVRPIWTLEEMNVNYEVEMLPFPPRVFKPDYLEINILGLNFGIDVFDMSLRLPGIGRLGFSQTIEPRALLKQNSQQL